MPVNSTHPKYDEYYPLWEKVEDAADGQEKIKKKGEKYLPDLGAKDKKKYDSYKNRAIYTNFTGRILQSSISQIFRKDPIINGVNQELLDNITLTGADINYFSREAFCEALVKNRFGILVDYSEDNNRPYLTLFEPEDIINWRTTVISGIEKLSMVMIKCKRLDGGDEYHPDYKDVWKEYYLDEQGIYNSREHEEVSENGVTKFVEIEGSQKKPVINDKLFDYIPFFIYPLNGKPDRINNSPLLNIANLNIGHYKNSADYENMLYWTGSKTIIAKGWDKSEVFPVGGVASGDDLEVSYLEASSDSGLANEMQRKEERIAMLGSQLMSGKGRYVASAETSRIQSEGEYATLADMANSMSYMMTKVLRLMVEWNDNIEPDDVSIEYNTDYEITEIPQGRMDEFMRMVDSGHMSPETMFYNLKAYEVYPTNTTFEEEQKLIQKYKEKKLADRENQLNQEISNLMQQEQPNIDDV